MTTEIQTDTMITAWNAYSFLRSNCSKIEIQGIPYSFIWRSMGNNVPDEIPVRVWSTDIDKSLLEKLKEKIPHAFNETGMILETVLRDVVMGIPLNKDEDNEVCFRKNLAKLCGYDYHPSREESADDCGETYWYKIPAKFKKIDK